MDFFGSRMKTDNNIDRRFLEKRKVFLILMREKIGFC